MGCGGGSGWVLNFLPLLPVPTGNTSRQLLAWNCLPGFGFRASGVSGSRLTPQGQRRAGRLPLRVALARRLRSQVTLRQCPQVLIDMLFHHVFGLSHWRCGGSILHGEERRGGRNSAVEGGQCSHRRTSH